MTLTVMLAVVFGAMLHATWNALVKSGSDKLADSILMCACAGALSLVLLPFLPPPAPESWPYLAASVVIHALYFCLVALAYRHGEMILVYPLMRGSAPLFSAALAALLVGDDLNPGGWIGVTLLCAGVVTLALDGHRARNVPRRVWLFGLGNAAVIVLYTLVDGVGARASGQAWSYVLWMFLLQAPPLVAIGLALRVPLWTRLSPAAWGRGFLSGGCTAGAYGIALWAMTIAPIGLVAALRETSVLFGAAIAAVVLKERFGRLRWLAVGLILSGAAAMKGM